MLWKKDYTVIMAMCSVRLPIQNWIIILENCGVEPYAVTNMYLGPENPYDTKFAPCSWITGTAGWMYRCITEFIFGVSAEYEGLKVAPCIPKELDNVKVSGYV